MMDNVNEQVNEPIVIEAILKHRQKNLACYN
jgi:hypothetical protein